MPNDMGRPSEVLQANIRQQANFTKATNAEPRVVPPPPAVEIVRDTAVSKAQTATIQSKTEALETLPDEDLRIAGEKFLPRCDKRWGRERLIEELVKVGVDGMALAKTPPPPSVKK